MSISRNQNLAYVVGAALGDGNLSNPNGRAVRLRITCDAKYSKLIKKIKISVQAVLPDNKVALVKRKRNCIDVSCYSNKWEKLLGWQAKDGPKYKQKVSIPEWIKARKIYKISCLRGLIETDGSVYVDRGYKMVIFKTIIPGLAKDVLEIITSLGFRPHIYKVFKSPNSKFKQKPAYHIRVSKSVKNFIRLVNINKS